MVTGHCFNWVVWMGTCEKSGGRKMFERYHIDWEAYHHQARTGPCFICQIVARNPDYPAYIVYEDDTTIAFLDKFPYLYGWTLVAPRDHRE
jgi:ATP adenylyltransferase